jgi:hypothetical protein
VPANDKRIPTSLLVGGLLLLTGGLADGRAEPASCGVRVALDSGAKDQGGVKVSLTPEPDASRPPLAVWENDKGQFRRAGLAAAGDVIPAPRGAVRLYVLAPRGDNEELSAFYGALTEEFRDAPKPSFLPTAAAETAKPGQRKRRAVGNDIQAYRTGSISPAPGTGPLHGAEVVACGYDVSSAGAAGDPSP